MENVAVRGGLLDEDGIAWHRVRESVHDKGCRDRVGWLRNGQAWPWLWPWSLCRFKEW